MLSGRGNGRDGMGNSAVKGGWGRTAIGGSPSPRKLGNVPAN